MRLYMKKDVPSDAKVICVIVHGLCEHQGRYDYLVGKFNAAGIGTYRFDHRGHGRSEGERTYYDSFHDMIDDAKAIVDLAKAHVCAVSRMVEGRMKEEYEIFNVGTGRPVSVLELIKSFEKVNNLKLNYKIAPRRPGDVVAIWADPARAEKELGWKAERSVDETLAAAWAWEKHLAEEGK